MDNAKDKAAAKLARLTGIGGPTMDEYRGALLVALHPIFAEDTKDGPELQRVIDTVIEVVEPLDGETYEAGYALAQADATTGADPLILWWVRDTSEEGATVVEAPTREAAWLAALPDLGIEPGDDAAEFDPIEYAIQRVSAEDLGVMQTTIGDYLEAARAVLALPGDALPHQRIEVLSRLADVTGPQGIRGGIEVLENAPADPIAELLVHLTDRARRIPQGAAFHGGGLHDASRYNVAMEAIREIVSWDHERKGPVGDDCSACGELRACSPQGATGYPLCLACYQVAVREATSDLPARTKRPEPPAPSGEGADGSWWPAVGQSEDLPARLARQGHADLAARVAAGPRLLPLNRENVIAAAQALTTAELVEARNRWGRLDRWRPLTAWPDVAPEVIEISGLVIHENPAWTDALSREVAAVDTEGNRRGWGRA